MWNLPRLDIQSVSSARAGGFLPTVPPGESCVCVCVFKQSFLYYFFGA